MHQYGAQTFRIIGFKDLDHEFNRTVILKLRERMEPLHTDNCLKVTILAIEKSVMSKMTACKLFNTSQSNI